MSCADWLSCTFAPPLPQVKLKDVVDYVSDIIGVNASASAIDALLPAEVEAARERLAGVGGPGGCEFHMLLLCVL